MQNSLSSIEHVVVLMLENRSFDHMLGYLYSGTGNVSPAGPAVRGADRDRVEPRVIRVRRSPCSRSSPATPNAYFMPGADPGEGYMATNDQLFGSETGPGELLGRARQWTASSRTSPTRSAGSPARAAGRSCPARPASDIMGCFTPEALPVLSALATGYAVCDHWFSSVPTETLPNRAFACAATSQGHMDDKTHTFTSPSIFGAAGHARAALGDLRLRRPAAHQGHVHRHQRGRREPFRGVHRLHRGGRGGTLPAFTFLEPSWSSTGNSQHPNYDVALGEQLIHDVYEALRGGPGWAQTLLVITYDEHGGCYDHVPPPSGATPPDNDAGEFGFDFTRFGVRVPGRAGLAADRAGHRVPGARRAATPLDHTSILKTVQQRWGLPR